MIIKSRIADHKPWPFRGYLVCDSCWSGFVSACRCGGLIHNEYEADIEDDVILNYECDKCGDDWEFKR